MSEGNLPATTRAAQSPEGGNLPSTKKAPKAAPVSPANSRSPKPASPAKGRYVTQYGPEWVEHALAGRGIVDGNVLLD